MSLTDQIESKLVEMSERPKVPVVQGKGAARKRKRGDLMKSLHEDEMGKIVLRKNKPCFNLAKQFTDQGRDVSRSVSRESF